MFSFLTPAPPFPFPFPLPLQSTLPRLLLLLTTVFITTITITITITISPAYLPPSTLLVILFPMFLLPMTDSLSRLVLGSRTKTSASLTNPQSSSSNGGEAARHPRPGDYQCPGSSHMSGHLTSPEPQIEPVLTGDNAKNKFFHKEDQVWYNPVSDTPVTPDLNVAHFHFPMKSLDQMVETIQVHLMTHGVLQPIPIKYNSYVLHLVEGFANAQENIRKAESAFDEFKEIVEQKFKLGLERESQYRAEIKRLEVLLSRTSQDGLGAVTMARTNSVVDRSGSKGAELLSIPDRFRRDRISDSDASLAFLTTDRTSQTKPQMDQIGKNEKNMEGRGLKGVLIPKILDNENDFLISEKLRRIDALTNPPVTSSRDRRAHINQYHDGLCRPSAAIPAVPVLADCSETRVEDRSPIDKHMRDGALMRLLGSKASPFQVNKSNTPGISASSGATCVEGLMFSDIPTSISQPSQQDEVHSEFSFHAGDDVYPLVDNSAMQQENPDPQHSEQVPLRSPHDSPESLVTQRHHCHSNPGTGLHIRSDSPSKRKNKILMGNHSLVAHDHTGDSHVAVQGRSTGKMTRVLESVRAGEVTEGIPLSQSTSTASSITDQANKQTSQSGMAARIAATRAVANVLGGTKQKR
ncbi:hypothetical protein GGS21DRAFT_485770 [Xylaria nigripes]|nr:hypothetical protein GGS21DRAFT_485770 [Xylaria nigripes]